MTAEIILALTLWGEARGEPLAGKHAVASVIWNRAQGDPERFRRVCLAPAQFSCWQGRAGAELRVLRPAELPAPDRIAWEQCIAIAREMCAGRFTPTVTAAFFHNPRLISPAAFKRRFSRPLTLVCMIGKHAFYREEV